MRIATTDGRATGPQTSVPATVMSLDHLGWDQTREDTLASFPSQGLAPARVAREDRGRTVALLSSSGVGRSTMINALLCAERQETGPVRADDSRGRRVTTRRELVPLAGSALLIDTRHARAAAMGW